MTLKEISAAATAAFLALFAWNVHADEGQELCERALAEAEAKNELVELVAEDVILAKVRFEKDYSSRFAAHGPYVEKETQINRGGREMVFLNEYGCTDDGALVHMAATALDETLPSTLWKKGLPILKFPLYKGATWTYEGTHVTVIDGSDSKSSARASGYVVGYETLLTPGGSVSTIHVRLDIKWGKGDEKEHQIIDSWYAESPLRLVKRDFNDIAQSRVYTLNPASMAPNGGSTTTTTTTTTPDASSGGAQNGSKKTIIILNPKVE